MKQLFFLVFMLQFFVTKSQTTEKFLKLTDIITIDTTVVNYSIVNDDAPYYFTALKIQIPEGKIWKVDNVIFNLSGPPNYYSNTQFSLIIKVNNTVLYNTGSSAAFAMATPIWIKSGSSLFFKLNNGNNQLNGVNLNFHLSAQEYILE